MALLGCRAAGPPADLVKKTAESLFERAARGEPVSVSIPFTGQGATTPKLLRSDIVAKRQVGDVFECDVRLSYLNRIQQMEDASITIRFQRSGGEWAPL